MKGNIMPNISTQWRKYLYGISAATIPILVILGFISDELAVTLVAMANAIFIGGLAFTNTHPEGDA
jgi:uncharacterized membrane protein YkgB